MKILCQLENGSENLNRIIEKVTCLPRNSQILACNQYGHGSFSCFSGKPTEEKTMSQLHQSIEKIKNPTPGRVDNIPRTTLPPNNKKSTDPNHPEPNPDQAAPKPTDTPDPKVPTALLNAIRPSINPSPHQSIDPPPMPPPNLLRQRSSSASNSLPASITPATDARDARDDALGAGGKAVSYFHGWTKPGDHGDQGAGQRGILQSQQFD